MKTAEYWIEQLQLMKHPEGGYYKEIYRNKSTHLFHVEQKQRNIATSIYFLLGSNDKSHLHRLNSDEIWYFHDGSPLTIYLFSENGEYAEITLGNNPKDGEQLQAIIPAGTIFGAFHSSKNNFTLMGCMVNPGFDFEDFELVKKNDLLVKFPHKKNIIHHLCID